MRPILILAASCVPLAVLTVWSYVELRSAFLQPAAAAVEEDWRAETEAGAKAAAQAKTDAKTARRLAEVDLLAAEEIPELAGLPAESSLKPLGKSWTGWSDARKMSDDYLALEPPPASVEVEQLREAVARLEDFRNRYQTAPPPGSKPLLALVDRRLAALRREIDDAQLREEAQAVLARARAAFTPGQYAQAVELCDELLSKYARVLDAPVLDKVRLLRGRAAFWNDAERLAAEKQKAQAMEDQASALERFLSAYPERRERTPAELALLTRCEEDLRELKARLREERATREAAQSVQALETAPPAAFDQRLRQAADIAAKYPSGAVRQRLLTRLRLWLQESLPEKQLREPPAMQEAETRSGEIVRGFFKEVRDGGGNLLGYKRYPTYEQLLNPVSEVGTFRLQDLASPPGESTLARCVHRYNEARTRLLESPDRQAVWTEFAGLCESLDTEVQKYQARLRAEQPLVRFDQEAHFARDVLANIDWTAMEKGLGAGAVSP